ncbi:MAG: polysaccharide deacetylase family protein [Acidobacteriota bacterium]
MGSVLIYHSISSPAEAMPSDMDISPARFEQQLRWLSRWRRVVPLTETLSLRSRRRDLAITFDDGFRDNLTVALPLLEKFGAPMTLFVAAGFLDQDGYLSKEELREISQHPLITIGAHGYWHRHFNRLTPEDARLELVVSRRVLEEVTGKRVRLMAWPFGECNKVLERLCAECGYQAAWSVWKGTNTHFSRWRVPLGRRDHMMRFVAKASGVYELTEARLHRYQNRREQPLSPRESGQTVLAS